MTGDGRELTVLSGEGRRDPTEVVELAARCAKVLQTVVAQMPRKLVISGRQYLQFEAWQTLGQFYGCSVRTLGARHIDVDGVPGAYAQAEIIDTHTGLVIGGADAYCLSDEENWNGKPWFQLASMAQTRAGAKALRNKLAWVAVLAGYEATPAEEMTEESAKKAPAHVCTEHQTAFRRYEKNGEVWYSHKLPDGSWCNEAKARETAPKAPKEPTPATPTTTDGSGERPTEALVTRWQSYVDEADELGIDVSALLWDPGTTSAKVATERLNTLVQMIKDTKKAKKA